MKTLFFLLAILCTYSCAQAPQKLRGSKYVTEWKQDYDFHLRQLQESSDDYSDDDDYSDSDDDDYSDSDDDDYSDSDDEDYSSDDSLEECHRYVCMCICMYANCIIYKGD